MSHLKTVFAIFQLVFGRYQFTTSRLVNIDLSLLSLRYLSNKFCFESKIWVPISISISIQGGSFPSGQNSFNIIQIIHSNTHFFPGNFSHLGTPPFFRKPEDLVPSPGPLESVAFDEEASAAGS